LALTGNLFTSNVFGTHTGNIVGNSNVFGTLGLTSGDTYISNVLIGDLALTGNLFTSNVFGTHTGNIVGNSNVFGTLGLTSGDTYMSNVLIGDLALTGNLFTSNVFGTHTGNIVGNTNVLGNLAVSGNFSFAGVPIPLGGALSDETSTITTSNKISMRAPFSFNILPTSVPLFMLNVLPTAATASQFDITIAGTTIYTTKPLITSTSTSNVSSTSGTPGTLTGVISVPQYSLITASVIAPGSGSPAGAKFIIYCS